MSRCRDFLAELIRKVFSCFKGSNPSDKPISSSFESRGDEDCVIVGKLHVTSSNKRKGKGRDGPLNIERDAKPNRRTPEEIRAKYRPSENASSVVSDTKRKLAERHAKLERIEKRTAELRNEAEGFASMANELARAMENRKWWQI